MRELLDQNRLTEWLHSADSRIDKILLVLSTYDKPVSVAEIKSRAYEQGFRIPKTWNISNILSRSDGRAIRTPQGWRLSNKGNLHLRSLGVARMSPAATNVALDLRAHLPSISDDWVRAFVEEAVGCHESEFFRSAVVMSWLGAVAVLHQHVVTRHLAAFNQEATRVYGGKWKPATITDDLGRLSESEFLERIAAISIIGKNVKTALKECLDRRNGCGHPNSLRVSANQSAAHLETLLLNVFERF